MNKIRLQHKSFLNGNFLLVVDMIKGGKYGEYLDDIEYSFHKYHKDRLVYVPRNIMTKEIIYDRTPLDIGVTDLEFEDNDGILYVREHIKVHYYNSKDSTFHCVTIYNKEDISAFMGDNIVKVEHVPLYFKDKPYRSLRVYNYINHLQFIEGISIPASLEAEMPFEEELSSLISETSEDIIEEPEIQIVDNDEKLSVWYKIGKWFNNLFIKKSNEDYREMPQFEVRSNKSPEFYTKETFMNTIQDDISYYVDTDSDEEIIQDPESKITLKGKLIIDEIAFKIDLSQKELEALSKIK